jgi:hypothetical protein
MAKPKFFEATPEEPGGTWGRRPGEEKWMGDGAVRRDW